MIILGLLIVIVILLIVQSWQNRESKPATDKAIRLHRYFKRFLMAAPLIAAVVFSILFATVLTSRFNERCSHALIVLMLWLYATSYYVNIVFFWKNKANRVLGIIGSVLSIGTAILLTPLDRYVALLSNLVPVGMYILGIVMLLVYYWGILFLPRHTNKHNKQ